MSCRRSMLWWYPRQIFLSSESSWRDNWAWSWWFYLRNTVLKRCRCESSFYQPFFFFRLAMNIWLNQINCRESTIIVPSIILNLIQNSVYFSKILINKLALRRMKWLWSPKLKFSLGIIFIGFKNLTIFKCLLNSFSLTFVLRAVKWLFWNVLFRCSVSKHIELCFPL